MTKPHDFNPAELYDQYNVKIVIRERLDGGVPKDPEIIKKWVASKTGYDDEQTQKQIEEHMPDIDAATEGTAAGMWCGFKRDDRGTFIDARQVKAMLRESSTLLGITKAKRGSRQIIQHGFEVKGMDGGSKIHFKAASTSTEECAIHVMTAQGPRSALKRTDYAGGGTELSFRVWVLKTKPQETRHIGESDLKTMLMHAQENGLGANRSQGSGKFDVVEFGKL